MRSFSPLILLLAMLLMNSVNHATAADPIKPRALRAGDTIAIVAPARPPNLEAMQYVEEQLVRMGFKVKRAPNVGSVWGYLAGKDDDRAAGIMAAWRDPEVNAIFCAIGGSGATRLLDQLDYQYIHDNPKVFTGFSDITALHLAINKKANLVTFHSPTNKWVYGANMTERAYSAETFWRTIRAEKYFDGKGEREPAGWLYDTDSLTTAVVTLSPGVARGRLIGGNLSLIAALMGTPYEPDTKGRILFIEDVHEEPYRIDRMLSTLRLGGKLDDVAGVVLGRFADCNPEDPSKSFSVDEVLEQYFANRPYPVISRFPVGHIEENLTLPEGALAELDANKRRLMLLEDPVELPD